MGWYATSGFRRFILAYIEGAKGCGKTPLGVGILIYLLVVDGDRGAQFFVAAVGKAQAKIAFADAEKMVDASPALRRTDRQDGQQPLDPRDRLVPPRDLVREAAASTASG